MNTTRICITLAVGVTIVNPTAGVTTTPITRTSRTTAMSTVQSGYRQAKTYEYLKKIFAPMGTGFKLEKKFEPNLKSCQPLIQTIMAIFCLSKIMIISY